MLKSDVIKYFKKQSLVASALGINKSAVSLWPEKIPLRRAYELQEITNGALKVSNKTAAAA